MLTIKEKEDAIYDIKKKVDELVFVRKPLEIKPEKELNYSDPEGEAEKEKKSIKGLKALMGPEDAKPVSKSKFNYPHRNDDFIEHTLVV